MSARMPSCIRVPDVEQTVITGTSRDVAFSNARASRSPAATPMEPPRNREVEDGDDDVAAEDGPGPGKRRLGEAGAPLGVDYARPVGLPLRGERNRVDVRHSAVGFVE